MVRINLLPWRQERRRELKKRFLSMLGLFCMLTVGVVCYVHLLYTSWIDTQKSKNNYLKSEITLLEKRIEKIRNLTTERARLLSRMEIIQELQQNRPEVVRLFDQLARVVPDGLYFTNIVRKGSRFTIEGKSESNTRVSKLMRNIEKTSSMQSPKLRVIKADEVKKKGAKDKQTSLASDVRFFSLDVKQAQKKMN